MKEGVKVGKSLLTKLNKEQKEAVEFVDQPLLVLAGAGTGKTRVLTHKIAYLIKEKGISPQKILAATFTNKAAKEMKSRVESLLDTNVNNLWIGTFHSLCSRILRREAEHLKDRDRNFIIYDTDDSTSALKAIFKKLKIVDSRFSPKSVLKIISAAKMTMQTPDTFTLEGNDFYFDQLKDLFTEYQKHLKANNAFDFDDLLSEIVFLFKNKDELLKKYQNKFDYILVDEYQDTNLAQFKLISLLTGEKTGITVVGDELQSIYNWRGANIENILNFKKDFSNAHIIKLEQNYRSTQQILNVANSLKFDIHEDIPKKELKSALKSDELVNLFNVRSEKEEAEEALNIIDKLHAKGIKYGDIGILYRTNAQSRIFEEQLRYHNIPYIVVGGQRFYDRKEIKDMLAYLMLFTNINDDYHYLRIYNTPPRNIGISSLSKIQEHAEKKELSLMTATKDLVENEQDNMQLILFKRLKAFVELFDELQSLLMKALDDEISIGNFYDTLLEKIEYREHLEKRASKKNSIEDKWQNLMELKNVLISLQENAKEHKPPEGTNYLTHFLNQVSLLSEIDNYKKNENAVNLMTIHNAKGLEFDSVFIVGIEEGFIPHSLNYNDPENLAEEKRLFYVALTRAKERLYLFYPDERLYYGQIKKTSPSRFLMEIPEKHFNFECHRDFDKFKKKIKDDKRKEELQKEAEEKEEIQEQRQLSTFSKGEKVSHQVFGKGKVVSVRGHGDKEKVTVSFEKAGKKLLMAKYANLKKL